MALVVCKVCGKSFSDTRKTCIHCGAVLEEQVIESKKSFKSVNNKIDFDTFDNLEKLELEREFLKENKGALKYKQNITYDGFGRFMSVLVFIGFIIYIVVNIIVSVKNITPYNEQYSIISFIALIIAFVIMLIFNVTEIIRVILNKNSFKKYVYIKEFQKWLFEKKDVSYIPNFKKDSQKEMFDKIDLETMKL